MSEPTFIVPTLPAEVNKASSPAELQEPEVAGATGTGTLSNRQEERSVVKPYALNVNHLPRPGFQHPAVIVSNVTCSFCDAMQCDAMRCCMTRYAMPCNAMQC